MGEKTADTVKPWQSLTEDWKQLTVGHDNTKTIIWARKQEDGWLELSDRGITYDWLHAQGAHDPIGIITQACLKAGHGFSMDPAPADGDTDRRAVVWRGKDGDRPKAFIRFARMLSTVQKRDWARGIHATYGQRERALGLWRQELTLLAGYYRREAGRILDRNTLQPYRWSTVSRTLARSIGTADTVLAVLHGAGRLDADAVSSLAHVFLHGLVDVRECYGMGQHAVDIACAVEQQVSGIEGAAGSMAQGRLFVWRKDKAGDGDE